MTINLSKELESSIEAVVHSGKFASIDDAMAEAARLLLREVKQKPHQPKDTGSTSDPLLGLWSDYADEMDEIVADTYRKRGEETWREINL